MKCNHEKLEFCSKYLSVNYYMANIWLSRALSQISEILHSMEGMWAEIVNKIFPNKKNHNHGKYDEDGYRYLCEWMLGKYGSSLDIRKRFPQELNSLIGSRYKTQKGFSQYSRIHIGKVSSVVEVRDMKEMEVVYRGRSSVKDIHKR